MLTGLTEETLQRQVSFQQQNNRSIKRVSVLLFVSLHNMPVVAVMLMREKEEVKKRPHALKKLPYLFELTKLNF